MSQSWKLCRVFAVQILDDDHTWVGDDCESRENRFVLFSRENLSLVRVVGAFRCTKEFSRSLSALSRFSFRTQAFHETFLTRRFHWFFVGTFGRTFIFFVRRIYMNFFLSRRAMLRWPQEEILKIIFLILSTESLIVSGNFLFNRNFHHKRRKVKEKYRFSMLPKKQKFLRVIQLNFSLRLVLKTWKLSIEMIQFMRSTIDGRRLRDRIIHDSDSVSMYVHTLSQFDILFSRLKYYKNIHNLTHDRAMKL